MKGQQRNTPFIKTHLYRTGLPKRCLFCGVPVKAGKISQLCDDHEYNDGEIWHLNMETWEWTKEVRRIEEV